MANQCLNLKVIEVRDARLLAGISSKDITGLITLMTDGKLPEWTTEQELCDIGATVFSVRSGDKLLLVGIGIGGLTMHIGHAILQT